MRTVTLKCLDPTQTITRGIIYHGTPVRKSKPDGSYNSRYTTTWEECSANDATSFRLKDKYNVTRHISRKRFKIC